MWVTSTARTSVMDPPASIEAVVQRRPGVVGVPPGVDDGDAVVELEGVDEDVAQGVVRDGHRDRPQPGPHLLDRGHDVAVPRLFLEHPGDDDHGGTVGGNPGADQPARWPRPPAPELRPVASQCGSNGDGE